MKIIFAHKHYYYRDGASNYVLDWAEALRQRGHEVAPFAMLGRYNLPTPWSRYFISETNLQKPSWSPRYLAKAAGRFFYSFEAKKNFTKLCEDFKPDLLYVNNLYHHLSTSVLDVARSRHLPVVMMVNDYALINANYSLFGPTRLLSQAGFLFERWRGTYKQVVQYFIAPTNFVKDLLVRSGFSAERVLVVPYFLSPDLPTLVRSPAIGEQAYFLYAGRLSGEKGVDVLLQALAQLRSSVRLKIIGGGPEEKSLRILAVKLGLGERVEFLGHQSRAKVWQLMSGALAVCVPSLWYEIFGLVALEAMALGVPVVASRIGGLPEVVGSAGFLVTPGDSQAWAEQLRYVSEHTAEVETVARRGVARAGEFSVERHYKAMMQIYERARV